MSEEIAEIENAETGIPATETDRDYETEAKNLGWHNPEDDDFRGDPDKALDAKEFVEKGESEMPLLRANIKKLQKQAEEDRVSRDEFRSYMEGETDRQLKQQEAEFERRQREAARDGDVEAFDQIAKEKAAVAQPAPVANNVEAIFKSRNDWYGDDIEKTMYAQEVSKIVLSQGSNQSQEEVFTKIEDAVKKKFARSTPRNTPPPSVEGGRRRPAGGASKTYEAMPQANRTACDRMAKKWGVDKKDFVKNYWADQEK